MQTLTHVPFVVQPIAIVGLPERLPDDHHPLPDAEPFHPSAEDLAWDTGYTVGREDGAYHRPGHWTAGQLLHFAEGRQRGVRDRERAEARALGYAVAFASECSEPPAGLAAHERAAYRAGFAEGIAERDRLDAADAEHDAWVDALAELEPADWAHQAELRGVC